MSELTSVKLKIERATTVRARNNLLEPVRKIGTNEGQFPPAHHRYWIARKLTPPSY